jgi:hypothetical protein
LLAQYRLKYGSVEVRPVRELAVEQEQSHE